MIREIDEHGVDMVGRFLEGNGHLPSDLFAQPCRYWAYEIAGDIAGVIGLEYQGRCGLLRTAYVAPAFRGRGIGARLTEHLLAAAQEQRLTTVYLFSTGAGAYWERLGFRRVPVTEMVGYLPTVPQVVSARAGCRPRSRTRNSYQETGDDDS